MIFASDVISCFHFGPELVALALCLVGGFEVLEDRCARSAALHIEANEVVFCYEIRWNHSLPLIVYARQS